MPTRYALRLYVASLCIAAAALALVLDWTWLHEFSAVDGLGIATFLALALLSQWMAVNAVVGSSRGVRSSIAFVPLLALGVVYSPTVLFLASAGIAALNEATNSKNRSATRVGFNISQAVLAYSLGSLVFHWTYGYSRASAPPGAEFATSFFPFYGFALCFFGLNLLFVCTYIALRDGQKLGAVLREAASSGGGNLLYDLLASPIALFAAYLHQNFEVAGLLAVVLPLLLVRYSYLSALQLQKANGDLLRVLIKAIETRDPYTSGHSLRVSTLARMIAEDLGLRGQAVQKVETAALLHDIGKIDALYAEIISKDDGLTDEERAVIRTHATKGADLLQTLTSLERDVIVAVRHHHERFDGRGYPDGLNGRAIPLAARIIMICDAVDAMLSDRPYRLALPVSDVRRELERCSGSQFDPEIVYCLLEHNTLERAELLVDRGGGIARLRVVAG